MWGCAAVAQTGGTGTYLIHDLKSIDEWPDVSADMFKTEIVRRQRPAVLRQVARDWPLVRKGLQSPEAAADYLDGFYNGKPVQTITAPPDTRGRLFYHSNTRGVNHKVSAERLSHVLKGILKQMEVPEPWAIAMQGITAAEHLPGIEENQPMDLVPSGTPSRLWIGNSVTVAPHFDVFDNVACVVAGRRRFILFPPEQLPNLYVGPFDVTPAGVPISMVPLDDPDLDRFPRYREALAAAQVAMLEPGDAIFIPYMWWHGVQSLDRFNILVNYWWNEDPATAALPYAAFLHAAYVLHRDMPPEHRQVWRHMYDYYVFGTGGEPMEHLPPAQRGDYPPINRDSILAVTTGLGALLDNRGGGRDVD
jgi:hypothetical protein